MGLGKRIYTLWKLRPWVVASFVLAVLAAILSVAHISLSPPKLTPRSLQMATGTTHVIVDTPRSSVLDLRQNTYSFQALSQRAVLLGNVMANGQVRAVIAAAVRVPVDRLQVTAPLTPKQPRPPAGAQNRKKTSDLLKSTDQYRISIEANPTVPVLDIYAQAPTAEDAEILANTSITALRNYLKDLAATQQIPPQDQIRLLQLGKAEGKVITKGVDVQLALIAFALTFAFGCATAIFISRVGRGLRMAALADREQAPA
jgi:hypothetical protein